MKDYVTLTLLPTHVEGLRRGPVTPEAAMEQLARVENWRRVFHHLNSRGAPPSVLAMAEAVGGVTLTATISSSVDTGRAGQAADTRVRHGLGRVPESVVVIVRRPTTPAGGELYWLAAGLAGADGANETPWDSEYLFLRSNIPSPGGEFEFIVT